MRVGELDEEMVFESRPGETFILGASTWRIDEITHDRVLVSPAPGEPGKMPFWKGDGAGRPLEFGRRIGALVRELSRHAHARRHRPAWSPQHDLDPGAAENLMRYLADQENATGVIPDDRTIVIERSRDELGDWRVCVLTPFGSRIHTPWAMAVSARIRAAGGPDVEALWGDDGFVLRFPDADEAPSSDWFMVESGEVMDLVLRQLGSTALFAGRFREAAGRALLLPRRRADGRAPLWQQRKRAYDLLGVASRYPAFPMLLEAYRECLRDVFDMPALIETLRGIEQRQLRVHVVDTRTPSPFAAVAAVQLRRRTSSTTATPPWPNAAPRPSPSTRTSSASSWAKPTCANCSTPTPSPKSKSSSSASPTPSAPAPSTASTTCCCASAT